MARPPKPKSLAEQIAIIRANRGAASAPPKGSAQTLPPGPGPSVTPRPSRPPGGRSRPASGSSGRDPYVWGDNKRHSITRAQHQRNVRAKRNDRNPLYDPTKQLSGDALRNAAGDLVNLEYGPQRSALERELENSTTQGTALADRAAGYSRQIAQNDAGLVPQVQAIGQLLRDQLGANTTTASTAIDQGVTDARARAAEDQSVRGFTLPGQVEGAEAEAQKQKDTLAQLSKASQDTAAGTTANYAGLAALSGSARAQMGNEIQGQLLNRLANTQADVRARQADLAASEGPALSAKVGELRQQGYENLITQAGLDIKTKDLEAQTSYNQARIDESAKGRRQRARDARAGRKIKREADRAAREDKATEINSYGISNGEWKGMTSAQRQAAIREFNRNKTADTTRPGSSRGGGGTKTRAEAFKTRTQIDNALTDIENDPKLQRHVGERGPRLAQILTNRGAPPIVAQAAAEIARYKKLRPETLARLRRAGIKVPSAWINGPDYLAPGAAGPPAPGQPGNR